jgi:hypothetical protein
MEGDVDIDEALLVADRPFVGGQCGLGRRHLGVARDPCGMARKSWLEQGARRLKSHSPCSVAIQKRTAPHRSATTPSALGVVTVARSPDCTKTTPLRCKANSASRTEVRPASKIA